MRSSSAADDAFAASPRARALLRGRQIADKDLRDSGGTFTLEEVRRLLHGVSRQQVNNLVKAGRLLAVPGPSNRRRYPCVQFTREGYVDGLQEVQKALPTKNPWVVLNFLIHPDTRLQGARPIDLLRMGKIEKVAAAARRMAEPGA
jgi:hypothetical protein